MASGAYLSPIAVAERRRQAYAWAVQDRGRAEAVLVTATAGAADARAGEAAARRAMQRAEHLASLHVEAVAECADCRARAERETVGPRWTVRR